MALALRSVQQRYLVTSPWASPKPALSPAQSLALLPPDLHAAHMPLPVLSSCTSNNQGEHVTAMTPRHEHAAAR